MLAGVIIALNRYETGRITFAKMLEEFDIAFSPTAPASHEQLVAAPSKLAKGKKGKGKM